MPTPQKKALDPEAKINFFLISAHEIRTSLSAMKWLFKMLLDGDFGSLNETQAGMIAQARTSNERMIDLLNDTMNAIRTETAQITYAKLPVTLSDLVVESLNDFTSEAASKGMHLRYAPSPAPIVVIGDAPKLRIVLHNLLENAIKYGHDNTDITLTLSGESGNAVLTIHDRGDVIPIEEHSYVFDRFFRTSNNSHSGVGLGLYVTKNIVEHHGGTLTFSSNDRGDTTFTLTLPLG